MIRTRRCAPILFLALTFACSSDGPVAPDAGGADLPPMAIVAAARGTPVHTPNSNACWGQATRVFAQMGEMGEHASQQDNPRVGLRNLARSLADAGIIPDSSMASLGAFVATQLGLDISACG